jgi:hypothetical protein
MERGRPKHGFGIKGNCRNPTIWGTVPALAKRKYLLGQCLKKQWDFCIKMQTSGHSGGQLNFGGNAEKKELELKPLASCIWPSSQCPYIGH